MFVVDGPFHIITVGNCSIFSLLLLPGFVFFSVITFSCHNWFDSIKHSFAHVKKKKKNDTAPQLF